MNSGAATKARGQRGASLIEVLVSLLIITVGMLGLAGLSGQAQKAEFEAYQRTQALLLADDMANRLRANRAGLSCYDLGADAYVGTGSPFSGTDCDATADGDLLAWHNRMLGAEGHQAGVIVSARGCIMAIGSGQFIVTVAWQGLTATIAPANACARDLYGDETQRRAVSTVVTFADL
jgi:type IV pilus assembly protein PilV